MESADFRSRSDFEPNLDDFLLALEHNALARWWRAHAGSRGETGARVIPWERSAAEPPERADETQIAEGD